MLQRRNVSAYIWCHVQCAGGLLLGDVWRCDVQKPAACAEGSSGRALQLPVHFARGTGGDGCLVDAPPRQGADFAAVRAVSGKRVVLVLAWLLAVWAIVLAVLVWRGARTPHYQYLRDRPAEGAEE